MVASLIHPQFLGRIEIRVDILVPQLHLLCAQMASHAPVGQRDRFREPSPPNPTSTIYRWGSPEALESANIDDIDNISPAHVVADRDTMLAPSDPHADTVDGEAEAAEHVGEEQVLFHAVAASVVGDEFVVDGLGVDGDGCGEMVSSGGRGSGRGLRRGGGG